MTCVQRAHCCPGKHLARQAENSKQHNEPTAAHIAPFYLALLIEHAKSTPSYAFLRFLQTSSAPYLAASIANSVRRQHGHDLHSPGGVRRSFAFGTWPSHALHQVRKQGCPSNRALSPEGRQQAGDSGHSPFRGPASGRSPRARISNLRLLNELDARPETVPGCQRSNCCAGFNVSRCVTLAPRPTWKSVSLTHIRCRMLASFRATATIARSMLDRVAIRSPPRARRSRSCRAAEGLQPSRRTPPEQRYRLA
ncbi:hypothetical protein SAMN05216337_10632 [Bradyrhizobium brasilense]|uniref:Uncharacterized protein n=1 Tax=Bradyrhizobium brasilense TaxID=1419277 RepID=A0A1G7MG70_9BRAD|nr:hypothetical protein SAMN05216337_10632 [Bradyrhizobium brasilense]